MNTTTYKPEYCEMLKKHMEQGLSFESFGAKIGKGRTTLYEWVEEHQDFRDAKQTGEALAMEFFEKNLILKLTGKKKDIDPYLVQFALRTRFHKVYGERNKVQLEDEDELEFK